MLKILELRRQRGEVVAKMNAIANGEGELTAEQSLAFDELEQQVKTIDANIDRLERLEAMNAAQAVPLSATSAAAPTVLVKPAPEQFKGAGFARMAMSIAAGGGDLALAEKFAANEIGDKSVAMAISTAAGSGGALIPENMHSEVIELLRPKTVVRALGARSVPLPNGNLSMPKMTGGASASYIGEGADMPASESNFGDVKLSAKTMVTLVPISNQLIARAGFNVEQLVLADCLAAMAVREDKAFLRDDGAAGTPKGFKATATAAGRTKSWAGEASLNNIDEYLDGLILMLMSSDSLMINPGWALSPRTYMKLFGLRDGNGNKVYPELSSGLLKGYPIKHTNTIPSNLGDGSNQTEIYFADFNDVVIGEQEDMTVDFSKEATYKDSEGNLVSAFSRNQSLIRIVVNHDIGFRHPEGLALGIGVTW